MSRFARPVLFVIALSSLATAAVAESRQSPADSLAIAVLRAFDALVSQHLWPGFAPAEVPLALYDGARTYLVRHPSPPPEFRPVPDAPYAVYDGQHEAVRANSSIDIGGVPTATLLANASPTPSADELAATLIHESFHVFEAQRYPDWPANELDALTYPLDDARLLALRRLETAALRRSLAARENSEAVCWARAAVGARRQRYGTMDEVHPAYERAVERYEGLAQYVEDRALGRSARPLPVDGYDVASVRQRGYDVGQAWSVLLDRLSEGWIARMDRDPAVALDALLASAIDSAELAPCEFTATERDAALSRAGRDVLRLVEDRQAAKAEFRGRPGWSLAVVAPDTAPLWPNGFDPLNLRRVDVNDVLHERWVKLGNARGAVEVLDRPSLSTGAGAHPLFNGIRKLLVTGLPERPLVTGAEGEVTVVAAGVSARFRGATIVPAGDRVVVVRLPGASP